MCILALFGKKKPPKACPRCGETVLWRMLSEGGDSEEIVHPDNLNTFSPYERRAPGAGHGIPYGWGKKTMCRCGKCGYEATY